MGFPSIFLHLGTKLASHPASKIRTRDVVLITQTSLSSIHSLSHFFCVYDSTNFKSLMKMESFYLFLNRFFFSFLACGFLSSSLNWSCEFAYNIPYSKKLAIVQVSNAKKT